MSQRRAELGSSSANSRGLSRVEDHGVHRTTCGYCKSKSPTSIAHGLVAASLTVDDYQELLDRGWRRSGTFLYKPEMEKTCCRPYTIRLKVDSFVPAKEQTRVYRRMQRYLDGSYDGRRKEDTDTTLRLSTLTASECANLEMQETILTSKASSDGYSKISEAEKAAIYISRKIDDTVKACVESGELPAGINFPQALVKKFTAQRKKKLMEFSKDLEYSSNTSFQIAAILNRRMMSKNDHNVEERSKGVTPTAISEKLASKIETSGGLPSFRVQNCNGYLNFISCSEMHDLGQNFHGETFTVKQYLKLPSTKTTVHEKRLAASDGSGSCEHHERRRLEIRMKRSSFDPEEFALYKKYQIKVHNDAPQGVKESSYRRFLVDTPIIHVPPTNDNTVPPCGFGSFHQQYLIDGKLVAVGVVDILPRCLSSTYLFWDPDLAFLSLGKYSALQEIKWVQEAQKQCPSLQYYYLGFYIHSCPKMRYKAAYNPSELLCPVRYQWVPFQVAKSLLDKTPYVCLSDYRHLEAKLNPPNDEIHCASEHDDLEMEDASELRDGELIEFQNSGSSDDSMDDEYHTGTFDGNLATEDISEVLIQFNGLRFRFKDLQAERGTPDSLIVYLRKYVKVVGPELSRRMAYCLG